MHVYAQKKQLPGFTKNVRFRTCSGSPNLNFLNVPEPPFRVRFRFDGLAGPNLNHGNKPKSARLGVGSIL